MLVKKSGGKIFGAMFTKAEEKALNMEIQRQCAKYDEKHMDEIDAMILYTLHAELGFGEARLRKFHDAFIKRFKELQARFEMADTDEMLWLYSRLLRESGIDISKWNEKGASE